MTVTRNNDYLNTNNLFNSNSSINLNKSTHMGNKLKKLKNYGINNNNSMNNMLRPSTAPHKGDKEKSSQEQKRKQVIHHIQESKKGINNFNNNLFKINLRPSSAGKGKNNNINNSINKEKNEYESIKYNNTNSINIIQKGNEIELDLDKKYKNYFGKRRLCSPPVLNNNKMYLGNNFKYNCNKQRLPSPMIKSNNSNENSFISNINRSNTNYNIFNKNNSFGLK